MSDQIFLGAIIGPMYIIIGLSLLIQAKTWVKMAKSLDEDRLTIYLIMIFNVIFGLAIITAHNLWEWTPYLIITLTGWGAFLKGAFYLISPKKVSNRLIKAAVSEKTIYLGGGLSLLMGIWLSYLIYIA